MPLLVGKTKLKCRSRTMSDANLLNRRLDKPVQDELLLGARDPWISSSKKGTQCIPQHCTFQTMNNLVKSEDVIKNVLDKDSQEMSYRNFQAFHDSPDKTDANADCQRNSENALPPSDINAEDVNAVACVPRNSRTIAQLGQWTVYR